MSAQGNMSGAYFVGKVALLNWLNEFLLEKVAKVEECASGHHYIMCLDALYPGQVNFAKAKYNAALEWERIENLKIVQDLLAKNNVERMVDVGRLAVGKYQDNLEFMQWFKWWFDSVYDYSNQFNPAVTRAKFGKKGLVTAVPAASQAPPKQQVQVSKQPQQQQQPTIQHQQINNAQKQIQQNIKAPIIKQQENTQQTSELQLQIADLKKLSEKRTKESKFYFNKLRQVEILMGEMRDVFREAGREEAVGDDLFDAVSVVDKVEEILYAPYKEE